MIVKRVPDILSSPKDSDSFVFDKNGRFIYIHRYVPESTSILILYEVMFNKYIELEADSSIHNFKTDLYTFVDLESWIALPVDLETVIIVLENVYLRTIFIGLIRFNLSSKTYGLIDTRILSDCYYPELVADDGLFGLFYLSICRDERLAIVGNKYSKKAILPRPMPRPPPSSTAHCRHISDFDLNEDCSSEINVDFIKEKDFVEFQFIQGFMLIQIAATKFLLFNLTKFEWSTVEININFLSSCPNKIDEMDEWELFSVSEAKYQGKFIRVAADKKLVISGVKKGDLYRIPLRTPFKLLDISWNCALNAGLVNNALKANLPYSPIF